MDINVLKHMKIEEEDTSPGNSIKIEMDVYPKDSFKRFGGDLSEVLFSYLSFEDKFRYECVSKQFRRVVFNKQTELLLNHFNYYFGGSDDRNRKMVSFESILKKCPNLKSIEMMGSSDPNGVETQRQIYRLIEDNLKSLNKILFWFQIETIDQILKQFLSKVGPKIKVLLFCAFGSEIEPSVRSILKLCPNLNHFCFPFDNNMSNLRYIFENNDILLTKLKSFQMKYISEDIQRLEIFVENNNSLKSLEIYIEEQNPNQVFKSLLKLKELKRLKMRYDLPLNDSFVYFFTNLTTNLTKIEIIFKFINCWEFHQIYECIKRFKNLNSLEINSLNIDDGMDPIIAIIRVPPKNCKNLTHLSFGQELEIKEQFFDSFDKYFPKLLTINCENTDINEEILKCLTKLNLKSIGLHSKFKTNTEIIKSVLIDFIKNNPKLESIDLIFRRKGFRYDSNELQSIRNGVIHELFPKYYYFYWN